MQIGKRCTQGGNAKIKVARVHKRGERIASSETFFLSLGLAFGPSPLGQVVPIPSTKNMYVCALFKYEIGMHKLLIEYVENMH